MIVSGKNELELYSLAYRDLMQEFIDRSTVRLNMFHPGNVMSQDSQI